MRNQEQLVSMERISQDQQGTGAFDGGRITEVKPIGFPHEPIRNETDRPIVLLGLGHRKGIRQNRPSPS